MIGDHESQTGQAAGAQAAQELRPERLGLDLAEVQADHLATPGERIQIAASRAAKFSAAAALKAQLNA